MTYFPYNVMTTDLRNRKWYMYLRKSRQDDPNETVEEVLAKHEIWLQDWAEKNLGYRIPEEYIIREIVSGERISDRPGVMTILRAIEVQEPTGILCFNPSRLSRGDLLDCGTLIATLRFTGTLVATPTEVYDLENDRQRQYFQDDLLRGSSYLNQVKEVLATGREIAVTKRGAFIGSTAPYGYKKVKIGKLCTLEPHETEADVVRMMFNWYVYENITFHSIGRKLDSMGIKPRTGECWRDTSVRQIISNHHYDGKVVYGKRKTKTIIEDGKQVRKRKRLTDPDQFTVVDGAHPAIIDHETFVKANEKRVNNPRIIQELKLTNPLAGILVCSHCGHTMRKINYTKADHRYACVYHRPACMMSVKVKDVIEVLVTALEQSELPNLQAKYHSGQGNSAAIQQKVLDGLMKQLDEYKIQEESQYELLETKKYTPELFEKRNAALREKMKQCEIQIEETRRTMPKPIDYAEKIKALEDAISALRDDTMSAEDKNRILKRIIDKVEISSYPLPKRNAGCNLEITLLI